MRFLVYRLGDESQPLPRLDKEQMAEMGTVVEEATKAGVLLMNAGIGPTAQGARITYDDGELTVTDGPFAEAKELVGGWAIMEVRDRDEAIEWAKRLLTVARDTELRVRPIYG